MKLHFDSNQQYQLDAINSVINLFEGQPLNKSEFELSGNGNTLDFNELGFGNKIQITEVDFLKNLQELQKENEIIQSEQLEKFSYKELNGKEQVIETAFPNFTIEMETGTGKTYVYLRTIYELNISLWFL